MTMHDVQNNIVVGQTWIGNYGDGRQPRKLRWKNQDDYFRLINNILKFLTKFIVSIILGSRMESILFAKGNDTTQVFSF